MAKVKSPYILIILALLIASPALGQGSGTCTGLCLQQQSCSNNGTTSISGTVYAPNGVDPLPNVLVYVPNDTVKAFTSGVACGETASGSPLVSTTTAADGTFTLTDMPVGTDIPLVIQAGRWRTQTTINNVPACMNTPVSPTLTGTKTNLPQVHTGSNKCSTCTQGDIPLIALVTGAVDSVECVLRKIGIDDSEFIDPSSAANGGRIHLYVGAWGPGAQIPGADFGNSTGEPVLFNANLSNPNKYDVVMLACQGTPSDTVAWDTGYRSLLGDFANAGGRIFATHYNYDWFVDNPAFPNVAKWDVDQGEPANQLGYVNVNTNFPKGETLADWLVTVGASTQNMKGTVQLKDLRNDQEGVIAPTQSWVTIHNPLEEVVQFTFNTPVGQPAASQCGRVLYNDYHVETANSGGKVFPAECTSAPMTPQEKLLEFSLFDLTTFVTPDISPPVSVAVTNTPGTFVLGDSSDTLTINVTNTSTTTATNPSLTLTATLPTGLVAQSMAGTNSTTGWTCTVSALTCTRTTGLSANTSDPITLTVSVSSSAQIGAGALTVSATASGGGIGSNVTAQDAITVQGIVVVTASDATSVYGASVPALGYTINGFVGSDSQSTATSGTPNLTIAATSAPLPVGTYPITITQGTLSAANYTFLFVNGNYTVTPASVTATAGSGSAQYDGTAKSPSACLVSGTYTGDLTCTNTPATVGPDAGTTTIAPQVSGSNQASYAITLVNGSYTISQAPSATTVTCPASVPYSGLPQTPCTATVTGAGSLSPQSITVVYSNNKNTGTATASATYAGDTDHASSNGSATFVITPQPLVITADSKTKIYGTLNPPLTATFTGLVGSDTPATFAIAPNTPPFLATTASAASSVGNYPITVSGATDPNYSISFVPGTLSVTQAAPAISLATSQSLVLYGNLITLSATVTDATPGSTGMPTGTVNFYVGGPGGVPIGTGTLNAGVTAIATSTLPPGTDSITGIYSGDQNFISSTSTPLLQTVTAVPVVSISPDAITFAPQNVNTISATMPIVLTNIGTAPLSLSSIQVNGNDSNSFAILSTTCATGVNSLAAGASCTVNVAFSPTDTGDRMSSLVFTDNDGGAVNPVTQVIGLVGSAVSTSKANFTKQSIAAGNTIWFNSVLSLKGPHGDDGHELDMSQNKIQIFVTEAKIAFTAGGQSYKLTVPDGLIILDPTVTTATTTFDGVQWITTVPTVEPSKHLQQFDIDGEIFATGLPWQVPTGGLPGGIQNVSWSAAYSTDTPGIGVTWEWGAAVYTSFATDPGAYNGIGVKPIDDQRGPCNFQNSTNNRAGTPENFKPFWVLGATGDDMGDYVGDWTRDTGVIPSVNPVTVDPYPLVFTPLPAGSSSNPALVTVTNNNASLSAYVAGVTVTNGAEFTVTPASGPCTIGSFVLPPSSSCTYSVTFAPGGIGTSTGTIAFTFTPPPGMGKHDVPAPITVDMVGTGMGGTNPFAALSALSLKFPRQMINTSSASQNVMLVNAGGAPLTGIGVASNSGEFAITSNSCGATLAPAASCVVAVTFTPSAIGPRSGTLTFTYGNNSGASTQPVSMTGSGSAW